jgi:uncharacterized protein (DUF885 family)
MDRRQFLTTSSIAAGAALLPAPARAATQAAAPVANGDTRLNALFEEIFQDRVRRYPEFASGIGLDKGANADLKSKLDTRPYPQARKEDLAVARKNLAAVQALPPASLSDAARLNRDVVIYQMETGLEIQYRQRPAALSDHPAGRRLFRYSGFSEHRSHDRQCGRCRSLCLAPGTGFEAAGQ